MGEENFSLENSSGGLEQQIQQGSQGFLEGNSPAANDVRVASVAAAVNEHTAQVEAEHQKNLSMLHDDEMADLRVGRLRTELLNQVFTSIDERYGDLEKVELVAAYIVKHLGISDVEHGTRIARELTQSEHGNRALIDAAFENARNGMMGGPNGQ